MKHFFASLTLFLLTFSLAAQTLETVIQQGHELAVLSITQSPRHSLCLTLPSFGVTAIMPLLGLVMLLRRATVCPGPIKLLIE
ncbi:MAG: hypothetical protein RIB71_12640 [Imperialibacter sp.]|uniref:hypothetical protein n=1 Tax=Imperialibacter sp. TaxID=2038411 RepID=UPI0032EDA566